jgi:hemolysin III
VPIFMGIVDNLSSLPRWTQSPAEELANTISHAIGLLAGLIGTPVLVLAALDANSSGFFVGTIIFAMTMLTLYLGSTLYHAWPQTRGKCILQVFDHSAIFLLIAGTYTPFALGPLRGVWGWILLALIWALAIFGVIMKVTRGTSRHPKLALSLYLGMGWLGLIVIPPLSSVVPASTVLALVAGGVAYTAGVIFFVNERRRYNHFIWHLFVLAGTGCHFLALLACTS